MLPRSPKLAKNSFSLAIPCSVVKFIEDASRRVVEGGDLLLELAENVRMNAYMIRDEWIYPAYEKLYELNQGKEVADVVSAVKRILRIV